MPLWLQALAAIGGLAGFLSAAAALVRLGPERRKVRAEAERAEDDGARSLRVELAEIYERLRRVEDQRDALEEQLAERDRERNSLRERVDRLERILPAAIVEELLTSEGRSDVCGILDGSSDGFVLTSSRRPGRFVWVNATFAGWLKRTPAEVVALGYQAQVLPDSLAETEAVESLAWDLPVKEFGNRFHDSAGGVVPLRWCSTSYNAQGWAFARVRRERDV